MDFHPTNLNFPIMIIPTTPGGAGKNGINISLKNAHKAFIYCINQKGADATQCTWTLAQSTGNAGSATGTGEKAMTNTVPIWYSDSAALTNAMTAATAAKSYQQAITQSVTQIVVFEITPEACMDVAGGFDCVTVNTSDPAAANYITAFAYIETRNAPMPTPFSD
jgi:hypothetical protein